MMKKMLSIMLLVLMAVCTFQFGISSQVQADTVYSSFGSAPPGYSLLAYAVGWGPCGLGGLFNCQSDLAAGFSSTLDYNLDRISFVAAYSSGATNSLNIYLASGATQPDIILESFVFTTLSSTPTIYASDSLTHPVLNTGTKYWFVFSPACGTNIAWYQGSEYLPPDHLIFSGSSWRPQAGLLGQMALSVEGTPVNTSASEPATMLLLGLGLMGLAGVRRFKN